MFECCACDERMLRLSDLRNHIRSAHKYTYEDRHDKDIFGIVHLKMDRNSYLEVTQKIYSFEELLESNKSYQSV